MCGVDLAAHPFSVSYAQFTGGGQDIRAVVRLPMDDADLLLRLDRDLDGRVSEADLEAAAPKLIAYLGKHLNIRADGELLSGALAGTGLWRDPAQGRYLEATVGYRASRPVERISIASDLLTDLYASHRTIGDVRIGGISEPFVFERGRAYERVIAVRHPWRAAASFVRLGIEHIFTGYDHILFLFGLLLVGSGLRNLIAIVTSFTVAHSTTLALATLGVIQPTGWTIEAAIALSIAYVGFENLFVPNPRHRWKITFLFGLVHGFGFATVLREMQLPRSGLVASLFSFNAGVEIGQVAIVSLMYPLLVAIGRTSYRPLVTRVASILIAAAGLVLFYERIR